MTLSGWDPSCLSAWWYSRPHLFTCGYQAHVCTLGTVLEVGTCWWVVGGGGCIKAIFVSAPPGSAFQELSANSISIFSSRPPHNIYRVDFCFSCLPKFTSAHPSPYFQPPFNVSKLNPSFEEKTCAGEARARAQLRKVCLIFQSRLGTAGSTSISRHN